MTVKNIRIVNNVRPTLTDDSYAPIIYRYRETYINYISNTIKKLENMQLTEFDFKSFVNNTF